MRIPLFDIDWTLIEGGNKAHSLAFDFAINKVYGLHDASRSEIKTDGMIDSQILLEVLKLHDYPEEKAKEKMKEATAAMEEYYHNHLPEGKWIVLPGVAELLMKLQEMEVPCGLLTGNVESIGWHKVEEPDLKKFFSFGAFGDAAFRRVDLVEVARVRAEKVLKRAIPVSELFIVGDSPLDIACAKAAGIPVVAVAQGNFSREELQATDPDLVLDSLEDQATFLKFLEE
jgi:phosphoglycolate phosphatase